MGDKPFAIRIENPVKLPTEEDLTRAIRGLKKKIKAEPNDDKRHRLKTIKRELQWLRDQR